MDLIKANTELTKLFYSTTSPITGWAEYQGQVVQVLGVLLLPKSKIIKILLILDYKTFYVDLEWVTSLNVGSEGSSSSFCSELNILS